MVSWSSWSQWAGSSTMIHRRPRLAGAGLPLMLAFDHASKRRRGADVPLCLWDSFYTWVFVASAVHKSSHRFLTLHVADSISVFLEVSPTRRLV